MLPTLRYGGGLLPIEAIVGTQLNPVLCREAVELLDGARSEAMNGTIQQMHWLKEVTLPLGIEYAQKVVVFPA